MEWEIMADNRTQEDLNRLKPASNEETYQKYRRVGNLIISLQDSEWLQRIMVEWKGTELK